MSEIGGQALGGEEEFINITLFDEVDFDRTISGRGRLIQIYNSEGALWEHRDEKTYGSHKVPAGYKVYVVAAYVKFT